MGQFSVNATYSGYNRNNAERQKEDYYATPPWEVTNILNVLDLDFNNLEILEPCCGGGHMIDGINKYLEQKKQKPKRLTGIDLIDRGYRHESWKTFYRLDFLAQPSEVLRNDVVIMNPPFKEFGEFTKKALELTRKYLIVLGRTQALEGKSRFKDIFSQNPPSDVFIYVDRINCWKDGIEPTATGSASYAWFVWDKANPATTPRLHWITRTTKEEIDNAKIKTGN